MAKTEQPPDAKPDGPPAVSRFEFNLLRLLRFLLGHMPPEQAMNYLTAKLVAPPCLSATCVRLAEDTIAKACVLHLVKAGGWRQDKFLRAGKPTAGRVWERIPLDERQLTFSKHPLSFLIWLTAEKVTDTKEKWDAPNDLTPADELFFALCYEHLKAEPSVATVLTDKRAFRDNALCWLSFPGDFATPDDPTPPSFTPWTSGPRAVMLECLQPVLTKRWVRSERAKGQIGEWRQMRQLGVAETRVLNDFLAACESAGRPDLARFVLNTARTILSPAGLAPSYWVGGLQGQGPPRLADRLETQRSALALPRQMERLQAWDRRARSVGYFDEEYQSSQLWKEEWEAARGDALTATARHVIEQLEPLRT
jgi:hypothetical protein